MVNVALIVPVMTNFEGFTRLMASVDIRILPIVVPNYEENRGVSWAWNDGMNNAIASDVAIITNDDIVFEMGCLRRMVDILAYTPGMDLVSAVNTRDFPEPGSGSVHEVDYSCFAVKPESFIRKFGYFDENFFPAYFEDNDMYRRIELAGGMQRKLLEARMYHKGSQTQLGGSKRVVSHEAFEANRAYYRNKWGGIPGEETFDAPFNGLTGMTYKDWVRLDS